MTPAPEIDSDEAIARAATEGDFSFLSADMRKRVEDGFRRMTEEALASGEPRTIDFEDIKRRGRERLQAARAR
jgi:hypothetical protein